MTSEEGHLSDEDGRTPGERRLARVRHSTQPFGDVEWISSGFRVGSYKELDRSGLY